jgi:hypothetical protein
MKEDAELEALLREHRFENEPKGEHLADDALAAKIDHGEPFTELERAHLVSCRECRNIAGMLLRARPSQAEVVPLFQRRSTFAGLAAIAATMALLTWMVSLPPDDDYGRKGSSAQLTAEVSLLATDAAGARRDLASGDRLRTTDRLGFRYGNPAGEHRTLTIVGWDGAKVHWYHPESPRDAAPAIKAGPEAIAVRMPFDVELSDHAPGKLVVMAAFDLDPKLAEEKLASKTRDRGTFFFELEVEAPK